MNKLVILKKLKVKYVFIIALLSVILDQAVKYYIDVNIAFGQSISLIKSTVSLYKIYNTGAAFSILEGNVIFLAFMSFIAALFIIFYFLKDIKEDHSLSVAAWGLILGGTLGNFVDRLVYGHVIDYIKLDFINFPIFNLADIFINIGAIIVIAFIIFENNNDSKT